eukprot:scaffold20194_cov30-Cyclotella_meneghiniana.AAC.1
MGVACDDPYEGDVRWFDHPAADFVWGPKDSPVAPYLIFDDPLTGHISANTRRWVTCDMSDLRGTMRGVQNSSKKE